MKTIVDLENMKLQSSPQFGSAYECFIGLLENYYISKFDGKERIKNELNDWDKEAQLYIVDILIKRIGHHIKDFDPNDLLALVK